MTLATFSTPSSPAPSGSTLRGGSRSGMKGGASMATTRSVEGGHADRLARKDAVIHELRERNRTLEQTLFKHGQQMDDMKKANRKLSRRTKEQSYVGSMLRRESAERIVQIQKVQSLENVVDWGDVGRRHTVEQVLTSKTEEIEALRAELAGCELKLRREKSRGNNLAARVSMLESIAEDRAEQAEKEKEAVRAELETQLEVSDRNAAMVSRQNGQFDEMLRRMGRDLVASRIEGEELQRRLGDANVLLVLQKMVTLKRAETLAKLKAQLAEQNRLVVQQGGTAVDTEYLEKDVGVGFNHKLNQLDAARHAAINAREDLEKGREEFEEMKAAKDRAEARTAELEQLASSAQLQVEQLSKDADVLRNQLRKAQSFSRPSTSTAGAGAGAAGGGGGSAALDGLLSSGGGPTRWERESPPGSPGSRGSSSSSSSARRRRDFLQQSGGGSSFSASSGGRAASPLQFGPPSVLGEQEEDELAMQARTSRLAAGI
jgi:hypothetical protein